MIAFFEPNAKSKSVVLGVRKRGNAKLLTTGAGCLGTGHNHYKCSVDCDGGGVDLDLDPIGDSLMVILDRGTNGSSIALASGCDPEGEDVEVLDAGLDDRRFKLKAVPVGRCFEAKELFELRSK